MLLALWPHSVPMPHALLWSFHMLSPPIPLLGVGMDAVLVVMGLSHAILSPSREAPPEQVKGFLPLPITHISPVN